MLLKKALILVISFLLNLSSISIVYPIPTNTDGLVDQTYGYMTAQTYFSKSIYYSTSTIGNYYMVITLNGKTYTSSPVIIKNTKKNVGFSSFLFDGSTMLTVGNTLNLRIINSLNVDSPNIYSTSITFDLGYSISKVIRTSREKVSGPKCYLAIVDGKFGVYANTYSFLKYDEIEYKTQKCFDPSLIYIECDIGIRKNVAVFKSCKSTLYIKNHPNGYSIGTKEFDSVAKQNYVSIPLTYNLLTSFGYSKFRFQSPNEYAVSRRNLVMKPISSFSSYSDFKSSAFYMPFGIEDNSDPFRFEVLIEGLSYLNDSFVVVSDFYADRDPFGSCYKGDFCVYKGESR